MLLPLGAVPRLRPRLFADSMAETPVTEVRPVRHLPIRAPRAPRKPLLGLVSVDTHAIFACYYHEILSSSVLTSPIRPARPQSTQRTSREDPFDGIPDGDGSPYTVQ